MKELTKVIGGGGDSSSLDNAKNNIKKALKTKLP
jgi:hypothetical protein